MVEIHTDRVQFLINIKHYVDELKNNTDSLEIAIATVLTHCRIYNPRVDVPIEPSVMNCLAAMAKVLLDIDKKANGCKVMLSTLTRSIDNGKGKEAGRTAEE